MQRFFEEVVRRKVLPVAAAYAIGGWLLLQVGDVLIGLLELPGWLGKLLVALVAAGLPIALILAWVYDWTPKGIVVTDDQPGASGRFAFSEPEAIDVGELNLARPELGELIGRHAECETLRECLRSAKEGTGGIVLIGGEPGVGKSRLGEEALLIGRDMGLLPLTGHAYEDRGAPFITSSELLEETIQVLPDDALRSALGSTAPEMAKLLPDLRRVFPDIPEPAELPPEQQQRFLFNSVLEYLKRLGQCCPVVMLLDDLHWADESSIALLEHLAPHVRQVPILMVVTFRDVESEMGEPFKRALAALSREPYVTRIALHRFSRDDVLSLLTVLSGHDPPGDVVDAIFEETNGNAFFVQSVYQHLSDEGRLFDAQGDWRTDIDTSTLDVPDSVRLVTGRRIKKLSLATRDMLSVAAVMGLRFSVPILEAAVGDDVLDNIEEAEAAQLLKRSSGRREPRYEFVHALARHTVLDSLSSLRQQKLHLQVAEAIEGLRAKDLDAHATDLALHLVEAGSYADEDKTVHWLKVAGENAMAAGAMDEAASYYGSVLSMLEGPPTTLRADLLQRRAAARMGVGDRPGCIADLQAAITAYESADAGREAASVSAILASVFVYAGRSVDALDTLTHGESLIGDDESPEKSRLLSARGMALSMAQNFSESETYHAAAVAMARRFDDRRLLADVSESQVHLYLHQMDNEHQAKSALEAASMRRELNQEWDLTQCLWMAKWGLVGTGRFEEAAALDEELTGLAQRQGNFMALCCSSLVSTVIEQSRGDLDASSNCARAWMELANAAGVPWGRPYQTVNLLLQGKDDAARELIDAFELESLRGTTFEGCDVGYWLSGKAWLGDDDILERFHANREFLPRPGSAMAIGRVIFAKGAIEALTLAGHRAEAAELYPLIDEFVQRGVSLYEFTFSLHNCHAGMAATTAEDWDNAERHFEKSLRLVEELPHRVDQARVRYWYGRMLLDRDGSGDRDRAAQFLNEGRALSEDMGMHGLIRRIDEITTGSALEA